jgi:hypothetical protein
MSVEGLENLKGVKLPKVSQIGIVVPDIGKKENPFPLSWKSPSPSAAAWKSSSYRC